METPQPVSAPPVGDNTYFFEEVEIEDEIDDLDKFESVQEDFSDDSDDSDSGLHKAIQSLKELGGEVQPVLEPPPSGEYTSGEYSESQPPPVIDDFLRNFLIQNNMSKTLETFQAEWYERQRNGTIPGHASPQVPDVYVSNQMMGQKIEMMQKDLITAQGVAEEAKSTWNKLRKERDFHRMHHRRVVQEKSKLATDMKRLKKHYASFEPMLKTLKQKYESAMKDKMMMRLERDTLQAQVEAFEAQLKSMESTSNPAPEDELETFSAKKKKQPNSKADSDLPADDRINPYVDMTFETMQSQDFTQQKTFKGHSLAIADIVHHPTKPIIATVSDDRSWKMWSIPNGDLVFCGEGHRDWLSSCDFHPSGKLLSTCSGDGTIKLWDFEQSICRATFADHSQVVWGCAFHDCGDFVVSCSIDHTAKLWDIRSERCRQTFRGHVDSVNSINFQPFSNNIVTASGDKTVSMWDLRSGLCNQTFFGHGNAVSHATFSLQGDSIVSSDADGVLKLWDVRMVCERLEILPEAGVRTPCNQSYFDPSGQTVISAFDDGSLRVHGAEDGGLLGTHAAHDDSVQCLTLDIRGRYLVSGGSDCTFRVWS